jgi:ABC-type transport system involved in cytochrome c biogenesis ATPase subunit
MKTDKRVWRSLLAQLDSAAGDRIAETLQTIRLGAHADRLAGLLSHGQKQWLEIGMLLMQEPKLLLLDEPVAGMTDEETERTGELFLAGRQAFAGRRRARHGLRQAARRQGHRAARRQRARRRRARGSAGRCAGH